MEIADKIVPALITTTLLGLLLPFALSITAISILLYAKGTGSIKRNHIIYFIVMMATALALFAFFTNFGQSL